MDENTFYRSHSLAIYDENDENLINPLVLFHQLEPNQSLIYQSEL